MDVLGTRAYLVNFDFTNGVVGATANGDPEAPIEPAAGVAAAVYTQWERQFNLFTKREESLMKKRDKYNEKLIFGTDYLNKYMANDLKSQIDENLKTDLGLLWPRVLAIVNTLTATEVDAVRQHYLDAQQGNEDNIHDLQERLSQMEDTLNRAGQPMQEGERRQRFLKV